MMEENPEIEKLLKEKLTLEKELKKIEKELKPFLEKMKVFCLEKRLRKFTWGPFDISYTRPRMYLKIIVKNEQIQDAHPKWVEERMGYARLSIKTSK